MMEFALKLQEVTGKGYLSYSALKYAADGSKSQDMKLFELYMKGLLKKKSDALTFGSLYDTLLLEPEFLNDRFFVINDNNIVEKLSKEYKNPRNTKDYKDWLAKELKYAESKKLTLVTEEDMDIAERMVLRLDASEVVDTFTGEITPVRSYLDGEHQYEINHWIGEIPVRGFLDNLNRGKAFISDSKSTRSIHGFKYDVDNYCYDIQAYIYTEALGIEDFYWVVQEKSSPYLTAVYKASKLTISKGREKFWSAVHNINEWLDNPTKDTASFALFNEI
jgi:hypothetical protein